MSNDSDAMNLPRLESNLSSLIQSRLHPRLARVLRSAGDLADEKGWKAYLVGGPVRDLMLGVAAIDLDLLVEEHGLEFARIWAKRERGTCKLYRRFYTAMVILPGGIKVDVTTTRSETYPRPGALPEVLPGSLEEDLRRRDFTINALAVSLNRPIFGNLIDVCQGGKDLEEGVIRVLHPGSFRDDPTRIFRAVRFQQRLRFTIEPETRRLIRTAVDLKLFEKVSAERLRRELELIFEEPRPERAIASMAEFDELRFIHPRLTFTAEQDRAIRRLAVNLRWFGRRFPREEVSRWRIYFGTLVWPLPPEDLAAVVQKFSLAHSLARQLLAARRREARLLDLFSLRPQPVPSRVYRAFKPYGSEVILILMSRDGGGRLELEARRYLSELRRTTTLMRGEDLQALGLRPGPRFASILQEVLCARLDGQVCSREEELELARRLIGKAGLPAV